MTSALTLACAIVLLAYGGIGFLAMYRFRRLALQGRPGVWPERLAAFTAPRAELGGSSALPLRRRRPAPASSAGIGFHVLRATAVPVESGRWQLRVRAVLLNHTAGAVVFDDLHTIVYLRLAPTPPLMTVSYHGNAIVLQDNTLFKEQGVYSIEPGDGIEIDVLTQVTRYVGAPAYYPMREEDGPTCILFGLIADFYATDGLRRTATPSDALLLFTCRSQDDDPTFVAITPENAGSVSWPPRGYDSLDPLAATLEKHRAYRPAVR